MKLNRKWLLVIALVLSLTMATAGTLAYLTDHDMVENTFTLGNVDIQVEEEFEQDAPLNPGVEVEKLAGIKNTHNTANAWVWMTVSVPEELADALELGWADGITPIEADTPVHEGYVSYVVKHPTELEPGESTPKYLESVTLSEFVDFQEGKYVVIEDGEVVAEIESLADVKVIVDGFAMQTAGFEDIDVAYDAYVAQWDGLNGGDSGAEGGAEAPRGDDDSVSYEVPADAYRVTTAAELEAAVANGHTTILLANGTYNANLNATAGKTLTLYGESTDAVLVPTKEGGEGADYDFDGSTVEFVGLTIDCTVNPANYRGYARMTGTYKDCVIKGEYNLYANSTFEYCTFEVSGNRYNVWTWGSPVATFDSCTFNSDGKAVLLYGQANTVLTIENCVFNDNGALADLKAAIEIGNDYNKTYELVVNNTEVNGYEINDKGINTNTTLWANKNSMGTDKLNVVVDGVDVY